MDRSELLAKDWSYRSDPVLVADAMVLIGAAIERVRSGRPSTLEKATLVGAPCYVGRHVVGEVEQHLPGIAKKHPSPIEPSVALHIWRTHILPAVRVVDLSIRDYLDPDLRRISDIDEEDIATGALARFLAPALVLSTDHSLVDSGFATATAWDSIVRVGRYSISDGQLRLGGQIAGVTVEGIVRAGEHVSRTLRLRPWLVLAVAGGLVGAAQYRHGAALRFTGRTLLQVCAIVTSLAKERSETASGLVLVEPSPRSVDLEASCARTLARFPGPASAAELLPHLHGYVPGTAKATQVRMALRGHPAFVAVRRGRWEVGERVDPTE
jgi:hypothetical protein